jgi:NAD dependent epimerase/dehydratase family enzyme
MTETGRKPPHETLDAQLIRYWEREAARFDELSARASFGWIGRLYARKAQRALEKAERSRAKEIARGRLPATGQAASTDDSPS